ncbi:MAG: hypothetical protein NT088_00265, partial [Candidatus Omnitrophica bacterium]|nr:hypothetical protein [Candidatus Omnitrophota bacterium]
MLYHLAFPASWIKSGTLNTPFFIFSSGPIEVQGSLTTSSPSYYPINAELFFTWLMLPLRNAFLADVGEAPFYIAGILCVYSILKRFDLNVKAAALGSFLWVLIPNIFKQLKTASDIDIVCAVLFLSVVFTLLLLKSKFTFKNCLLFGISLGLFIGTKFTNLVWLVALFPLASYLFYKGARESKAGFARVFISLSVILVTTLLFGGYMFIKNYIYTGDPIFPVTLKIFGKPFFQGLLDNAEYKRQLFSNEAGNLFRIFREGLGIQFFALILPGTFLPLIFLKYLKNKVRPLAEYGLVFATPLLMLILFRACVDTYVARYLFPYLSLALIVSIIFVTKLPGGSIYLWIVSFISIFAASFQLANRVELVTSVLISWVLFALIVFYKKQLLFFYNRKGFGRVIMAVLVVGAIGLVNLNNYYDRTEFKRYPSNFSKKESWQIDMGKGWKALNELTGKGSRVAYTGRGEFYPLFGQGLKNDVKYVSVNSKE